MPVVQIKYDPIRIPPGSLDKLCDELQNIIAAALTTPSNELAANDIQLWVIPPHELDRLNLAVQIIILFEAYPDRMSDLEKRKDAAVEEIKAIINPGESLIQIGWTWFIPTHGTEISGF